METEGDTGAQPAKKISLTEVVSDSRDKMRCMVMGSGCQQRMKEELEGERESEREHGGCDVIDCPEPRDSEFRPPPSSRASGHSVQPVGSEIFTILSC